MFPPEASRLKGLFPELQASRVSTRMATGNWTDGMADEPSTTSRWIAFRRGLHVATLGAIAAWWSLWDLQRHSVLIAKLAVRFAWSDSALLERLLFFALPIGIVFVLQLVCYSLDRTLMGRRWTATDLLRLALWRTVSPTLAMLLVATGYDAMYGRRLAAIFWLIFAAILAMVGTFRLRVAEGIKLQRVKSGELYKRAFVMAKDMRTTLKRVYVVPAGRGHLTNAYGLSESIAVTDNYGKFLDRAELDFVIGHELGHVKGKRGPEKTVDNDHHFRHSCSHLLLLPSCTDSISPCPRFLPAVDANSDVLLLFQAL